MRLGDLRRRVGVQVASVAWSGGPVTCSLISAAVGGGLVAGPAVAQAGDPAHGGAERPEVVYVYDMEGKTGAQSELVASLAGLVNRTPADQILLTVEREGNLKSPRHWLEEYRLSRPDLQVVEAADEAALLQQFGGEAKGYVFYDRAVDPESVNVAASVAGLLDGVIADPSTVGLVEAEGLTRLYDATAVTLEEAYEQFAGQWNAELYIYQDPELMPRLLDVAVKERAFAGWPEESRDFRAQLEALEPLGMVLGYPDQDGASFGYYFSISRAGAVTVGSEDLLGVSATSDWDVEIPPQPNHAPETLDTEEGVHYVAFLMTEGENVDALTWSSDFNPFWFDSPHRGNFPMNWEVSPALADLHPLVLKYLHENAATGETGRDFFVTPAGRGIAFADRAPDPRALIDDTAVAMESVDQTVLVHLEDSWLYEDLAALLARPGVRGVVVRSFFPGYGNTGWRTPRVFWRQGKPIMDVTYGLCHFCDLSLDAVMESLNSSPADPLHDINSYSIVAVNPRIEPRAGEPWADDPMRNVQYMVDGLAEHVRVVTLDELMVHLVNNFGPSADWDGDDDIDVQDLLGYLRAFRSHEADVDGDEETDVQDLLAYLRLFREKR